LVNLIKEAEVLEAIWDLDLDKAPGLDGFTISFYRSLWLMIKMGFMIMMNGKRRKNKIGGSIKSSLLTFIPNEISLVNFSCF